MLSAILKGMFSIMISFNKIFIIGKELNYIKDATINRGVLCGDGVCTKALERIYQKTWRRSAKQR